MEKQDSLELKKNATLLLNYSPIGNNVVTTRKHFLVLDKYFGSYSKLGFMGFSYNRK